MTITVQVPRNTYTANGVQDTFAFTYRILVNADMRVFVDSALQQEGVDYNLVGVTELGGDIVFINAPSLNTTIILDRKTPESQAVVYNPFDPFPAKTHEGALDKLTMIAQETRQLIEIGATSGLPLDISGLFWNAHSLPIKNLGNPVDNSDAATKAYVDAQDGPGGGGGLDPNEDETINGQWTFVRTIIGVASGNLISQDLDPYTRIDGAYSIFGNWLFADGAGSPRKVAARNPRTREIISNESPTQVDEGIVLEVVAPVSTITLEQLDADTSFVIFAIASGFNLAPGAGVVIEFLDGENGSPPVGVRSVSQSSVVQVHYKTPTLIRIYGNGIS